MRYLTTITLLLVSLLSWTPSLGQSVQRYNATAEQGYGVTYALPKTSIEVAVLVKEEVITPGELNRWSNKYLGYATTERNSTRYTLTEARLASRGDADTEEMYIVSFDRKSIAPFVRLGAGNVLYSINGNATPPQDTTLLALPKAKLADRVLPSLPREYSLATTASKRAELATSYIYELRDNIRSLLSGELENMPKDGEAMRLALDYLQAEERRTLRLFVGDTTETYKVYTWQVEPQLQESDEQERILGYFTPSEGLKSADNQSTGQPLALRIKVIERMPILEEKELKKRDKPEGIVYRQPGLAELTLSLGGKELAKQRLPLSQLGNTQILAKKMLNIKEGATTAIYFDLRTGALERITNE